MSEWACQSFGFFGVATNSFRKGEENKVFPEELAYIFRDANLKREIKISLSKANVILNAFSAKYLAV